MKYAMIMFTLALSHCASAMYTFSKEPHIYNGYSENRIYTGSQLDINMVLDNKAHGGPLIQTVGAIDLPFSLVLDTVFLPYTLIRYIVSPPAPWSKDEIIVWYSTWVKGNPKHFGKFYYQGSDEKLHHFIARPTDKWVIITCYKGSITLAKGLEFPYDGSLKKMKIVDPEKDFTEILENQSF